MEQVLRSAAWAIARACAKPKCAIQRSSSQDGQESSMAGVGHSTGARFTLRRTALANPAAARFCCFTNSTDSWTAA